MKVVGAHHTSYTVSDIERSKRFYCGLLGCEVIWEREIIEKYFRDIVAFADSVVKAAQLRIAGSTHILEVFDGHVSPGALGADRAGYVRWQRGLRRNRQRSGERW